MRYLRLLIIAIATIFVLALGAFAIINRPVVVPVPGDDDIIIKGGSLEIECGKNQGKDCFGDNTPGKPKPKHKDVNKHILQVVVMDSSAGVLYSGNFNAQQQPSIKIVYK